MVALFQWCHHLLDISLHICLFEIWIELKLKGLILFCFLYKPSSSIPNCQLSCIISYLDHLFCWNKKYQLCEYLCSVKVSAKHWHALPLPLELRFCNPKMLYRIRWDTQKHHQKSRAGKMLPCLWGEAFGIWLCYQKMGPSWRGVQVLGIIEKGKYTPKRWQRSKQESCSRALNGKWKVHS